MKCRNTRYDHECHPCYAAKYDGYCLNCANAGVPDLDGQIADLRAQVFGHCGTAVSELTPERLEWLRKVHYDRVPTCDECMLLSELDARDRQLAELREACQPFAAMAEVMSKEDMPMYAIDMMDEESGNKVAWTSDLHHLATLLPPPAKEEPRAAKE